MNIQLLKRKPCFNRIRCDNHEKQTLAGEKYPRLSRPFLIIPIGLAAFILSASIAYEQELAAPDLSTPKKALHAFIDALAHDNTKLASSFTLGSEKQLADAKLNLDVPRAVFRLGRSVARFEGDKNSAQMRDYDSEWQSATERLEGDKATIEGPLFLSFRLQKSGQIWKIDLQKLNESSDAYVAAARKYVAGANELANKLEQGFYKKREDFAKDSERLESLLAAMGSAQNQSANAQPSASPTDTVATARLHEAAEKFTVGRYEEAFKLYDAAILEEPKNPKVYLGRGWAFFCTTQKDAALKDFDQAIRLNPKEAEGYFRRGLLHASNSEQELAINDFTKAIESQPKYAEAYHARGTSRFASKQIETALDDFNNAIRIESKNASAYVSRGRALIALHETDKALSDFNRAIELANQDPKTFLARGVAYFELGRQELAQKDFEQAISLSPEYVPAYQKLTALYSARKNEALASLNLGRAYFYSEEYGKATDQFNRVTKLEPKMAAAHIELGRSLSAEAIMKTHAAQRARKRNGTYEESQKMDAAWRDIKAEFVLPALSSLEEAVRLEPRNARAYLEIGKIQFYARFSAAIPAFERAIEFQPAWADAHFWLGVAKYVHGDSREVRKEGSREEFQSRQASKDLDTAIELDPEHAGAYYFRARVHHWLKDYRLAVEDDDRSIALSSKSLRYVEFNALRYSEYDPSKPDQFVGLSLTASAYADRGDCHFSVGEPETAVRDLDQAIASVPQIAGLFYSRGTIYYSNGDRTKALADFRRASQLDPQNTHYSELITSMTVQRRNEWSSWQTAAAAIGAILTTAVVVDLLSGDNNRQDYSPLYYVPAPFHPYPMGGTKQQVDQWWRDEKYGNY